MLLKESIISKPIFEEKDCTKLPEAVLCRVTYPICHINERNANQRVYEKAVWDKVLADETLQEMMQQRRLFGHGEHPVETQSDLQLTSHVIHNMWIDEASNTVFQTIDVLDTPTGRIVDTILRADCLVGVSTRAEGDLEESEDDDGPFSRVLPESYRYITTDFTADPSTFGALPIDQRRSVVASIQNEMINEKANKDEQGFARRLLEKMKCEKDEKKECENCGRCKAVGEKKDEEQEEKRFGVILKGSDIGQKKRNAKPFDSKEDANAYAKRMNKQLSPGEKSYYKLKYVVVPMDEERTIESLIEEGRLRECNKFKQGDKEGVLTIKEGSVQITVDGKTTDLGGIKVASVYPDGAIHLWAKEEAAEAPIVVEPEPIITEPEPIIIEPEVPGAEMTVPPVVPYEKGVVPEGRKDEISEPSPKFAKHVFDVLTRKKEKEVLTKEEEVLLRSAESEMVPESKVEEKTGVDQLVAQIDELKAKIDSEGATPEMEHQLKELEAKVSRAGGEIPESAVAVEGEVSGKLAAGNLLRKGDTEDYWVVDEVSASGASVYPVGEFEKAQQVPWDALESYNFVKVGEKIEEGISVIVKEHEDGWAVALSGQGKDRIIRKYAKEKKEDAIKQGEQIAGGWDVSFEVIGETKVEEEPISNLAKELVDLKVKEASTRAEQETAVEAFTEISEKIKTFEKNATADQHKMRMLISKIKNENTKQVSAMDKVVSEGNLSSKEVDALRSKIEEKAKLAADAQSLLEEMQENMDRDLTDLKESISEKDNEVTVLSEKHVDEIKEAKEKGIEEGRKVGLLEIVNEYVACKLAELGIRIGENTRALLDECASLREVDDILEKVTDIMRRSALHSGTVDRLHIETPPVDSEQSKIEEEVNSAFQGMGG